jgi:hypothetical protein
MGPSNEGGRFGGIPTNVGRGGRFGGIREQEVDRITGAPANVRSIVGGSPIGDRLANMQRFYPEATAEGDDNFIFNDPKTKRPTLYNPPGLDIGDVASVGRETAQFLGGTAGGIFGLTAAAPTGMMAAPVSVPIGAALGSQAAGQAYDLGMRFINGMVDTRSTPQRLTDAAGEIGLEAVGTKLGAEIPAMAKGLFNTAKNRFTGAGAGQVARDMAAMNVRPSAGVVSGDRALQSIENAVAQTVGGAGIIQASDDAMIDGIQAYASEIAQELGPVMSKQGVGATIRGSAKTAVDRFSARSDTLFNKVSELIPPTLRAPPTQTMKFAATRGRDAVSSELPKTAKAVQNPKVSSLLDGFIEDLGTGDGMVSYSALKQLRSRVGKILGDPRGYPDFDRADLKQLYGSLSGDMGALAEAAGPDAVKAHSVASRYYRRMLGQNIELMDNIVSKGWDEQASSFALQGAKDGGSKLAALRRNMLPEEWDIVSASVFDDLGKAAPGVQGAEGGLFSASTFLTNYNKLAPEAKAALFGGKRYAGLRPKIERLARGVAAIKDTAATRGHSNTARMLGVMGLIGAGGTSAILIASGDIKGGAAAIGGALLAPRAAAKLMTNPRFVGWLADTATNVSGNYTGIGAQLGRLTAIAKADPEIREEIYQYFSALRQAGVDTNEQQPRGPIPQQGQKTSQ